MGTNTFNYDCPNNLAVWSLSCVPLCDPMDCCMPGFPLLHYFLKFVQINVHSAGDAIQPSHPRPPSSPFAFNLSQQSKLDKYVILSITDKILF